MATKSDVIVCDVLHKNELSEWTYRYHDGIARVSWQGLPAQSSIRKRFVDCREARAKRHLADADTPEEGLDRLEPVAEDWHALMNFLMVRS